MRSLYVDPTYLDFTDAGDIQTEISMKYFLFLSLLLALFAGQDFPSQGYDRTPDLASVSAEREMLPTGESGPKLAFEGDDSAVFDPIEIVLPSFRPLRSIYYTPRIPSPTTTPYAIRAPPISTTA